MEKLLISNTKRDYLTPEIQQVILDQEISLCLQSNSYTPPELDDEEMGSLDYFNNDPYKNQLG